MLAVISVYLMCFILRFMEYFLLRTDETFWGEAFIHKLLGIVILFAALKVYRLKPAEIGFVKKDVLRRLSEGMAFGLFVFVPAYSIEIFMHIMQGRFETLSVYVSAYSVTGTVGMQTGFLFFLICIAGNIINIIMEEGVFRGFFQKMLEKKYSFFSVRCHRLFPVRTVAYRCPCQKLLRRKFKPQRFHCKRNTVDHNLRSGRFQVCAYDQTD